MVAVFNAWLVTPNTRKIYLDQAIFDLFLNFAYIRISMFHRAFFNSIIDKHQHTHFFTFKTLLV